MEFDIRNINVYDKDSLHELIGRVNKEDNLAYSLTEEWLDYIIENMSEAVFVGFYKDMLVGLGTCMINSVYKDQATLNVIVVPEFRNMGLASLLYDRIYEYAKNEKVEIVEMYVKKRLNDSLSFAEKKAFNTSMYAWKMEISLKEEVIDLHRNSDLNFRVAGKEDSLDYKDIIYDGFGDELTEDSLMEILKDPSITVYLLEKEETTIGSITVQMREDLSLAYIYDIVIFKKQREKGFGSYLIKSCLEDLKGKGIVRVSLMVTESNKSALELYKRIGFKEVDIDLIMVKRIE